MINLNTDNNVTPIRGQNANWQKQAFINIYLPTREGGRRKLGSIGLTVNKKSEAELIKFLREDPSRIYQLLSKAEVDFRMAEASEDSNFDLSGEDE